MCISVFALVRKGDRLLVGVPKRGGKWSSEWLPSISKNTGRALEEEWEAPHLPSAYIFEGEHPDLALERVVRGPLGITRFTYSSARVFSYSEESDWYPGNKHWDLAFAYEVTTAQTLRKRSYWKELLFLDVEELLKRNFGWNNDFVRDVIRVEDAP